MKRILLLGDSIRLNYAPYVHRHLSQRAEICTPEDNCRFAKYTLHELPGWLERFSRPDVIHWNNGLWDIHLFNGKENLSGIEEYIADLQRVLAELKATDARLIFATSTPVRPENPGWRNSDIDQYNTAAVSLMKANGIVVNDLNALVKGHEAEYIREDDMIHLNATGTRVLGQAVVDVLTEYL